MPPFDLQGGIAVAAARTACVAGLLSVFGALVFCRVVMPRVFAALPAPDHARIARRLHRATQAAIALALAGTLAWSIMQSSAIASASSVRDLIAAVPRVMAHTRFGHLILLQLAGLACLAAAFGQRDPPTRQAIGLGLACIVLGLQAGHSHAAAMSAGPSVLLALDLLHLAGAGAWLGGLPPLLLVVQAAPARAGATAARWFSPLGMLCIAALLVSAAGQSWVLVGSLSGLVRTAYGWMLLVKLLLSAVLLGFAAANRYRLAPALLQPHPAPAKQVLVRSIAVQSGFGLAIVAAAAVLSNLPPAMHIHP